MTPAKWFRGVTPGDREAFVKAVNGSSGNLNTTLGFVLALLAPNLYEPLASLLEAFHVGNMPASALELYQGGSLFYLADILTKAIDALVADPFGYLGDVLPDLAYTYGEVGSGLKALLDMLASSGLDLGVDLPEDFSGIVSMVGGLIGFAIVSTGWLKIGEWQITSSSFNWFLFHAFNISYISLLLTRPRGNQENTSKEVVRGGMWQTLIWTISLPAQALIGGAVIWLYNLATGNSLSELHRQ